MRPKVSVWLTTYNHEAFIGRALESILMQKTSFSYEIVIGEDCSTDNTRQIVKSYKSKYPDKLRLFLPDQNLGMVAMFKASYEMCHGHYVAWMDGDDYWIDPYKLQKQVDFLDSNPEYVLHFHKVNILKSNKEIYDGYAPPKMNSDFSLEIKHLLKGYNPIASSSVLHRNVLKGKLPDWFFDLVFLDYSFYLFLLRYGKFKYSKEKMSIYRVHEGGAYSGRETSDNMADMIRFAHQLKQYFPEIKSKDINAMIGYQYYKKLLKSIESGSFSNIKYDLAKVLQLNPGLLINKGKPLFAVLLKKIL
ncbi:MAG TPA: glycosyltransferase [Anditalea sp.]|nr:glycosyltransferase [Anditalea sp.]